MIPHVIPNTPLNYITNKEEHAYMDKRKHQNLARAKENPNENWMWEKLQETEHSWSRQAVWGKRVLDFWCHDLGVAIEVDGPEHDEGYDNFRDEYNFRRSGIVVLRIRNRNEEDAEQVLNSLQHIAEWKERRSRLGLEANTKAGKRRLADLPYDKDDRLHDRYLTDLASPPLDWSWLSDFTPDTLFD